MGTYVIGDVHGCFEELMTLMSIVEKDDCDARYIFTGDLLDRGAGNIEMARWAVLNIKSEKDAKYRSVCGNHDDGIHDWYVDFKKGLQYGYQYGTEVEFFKNDAESDLFAYCEFTRTLPLYIEEDAGGRRFVITHGYLPKNYNQYNPYESDMKIRETFNWSRYPLYYKETLHPDITVVFGHCPVILGEWIALYTKDYSVLQDPDKLVRVYEDGGHVNVDTGCFRSSRLSAYRLEDGAVFYSGDVKVR